MSEYIPDTSDVRMNYVDGTRQLHGKDMLLQDVYAEFDHWLAEVRAEAWEEGFSKGVNFFNAGDTPNPYRGENK